MPLRGTSVSGAGRPPWSGKGRSFKSASDVGPVVSQRRLSGREGATASPKSNPTTSATRSPRERPRPRHSHPTTRDSRHVRLTGRRAAAVGPPILGCSCPAPTYLHSCPLRPTSNGGPKQHDTGHVGFRVVATRGPCGFSSRPRSQEESIPDEFPLALRDSGRWRPATTTHGI